MVKFIQRLNCEIITSHQKWRRVFPAQIKLCLDVLRGAEFINIMKFTIQDLDHLTNLAKIKLTKKEKETYLRQLSDILSYVEKLSKVRTDELKILRDKGDSVFRSDTVESSSTETKKAIIDQFDAKKGNLLKIKSPFKKK
jgi:aspartyl-tRNA(Asn)/glutamyl-tRNA(Gln) amidotransferase subunit C